MQITLSGTSALQRFAADLERMAQTAPQHMADALNQAGAALRKKTISIEAKQTGLSTRLMARAQRERRATGTHLTYEIEAEGGNVSLKYFGARETKAGVMARPWGVSRLYQGAFIKGGRFPDRVGLPGLNGQVYIRDGKSRLPIDRVQSGVFIPTELTRGATAAAFEAYADTAAGIVVRRMGSMLL